MHWTASIVVSAGSRARSRQEYGRFLFGTDLALMCLPHVTATLSPRCVAAKDYLHRSRSNITDAAKVGNGAHPPSVSSEPSGRPLPGAGGYGPPDERDPAAVARDFAGGRTDRAAAAALPPELRHCETLQPNRPLNQRENALKAEKPSNSATEPSGRSPLPT